MALFSNAYWWAIKNFIYLHLTFIYIYGYYKKQSTFFLFYASIHL